jgi:hypothetical protein
MDVMEDTWALTPPSWSVREKKKGVLSKAVPIKIKMRDA